MKIVLVLLSETRWLGAFAVLGLLSGSVAAHVDPRDPLETNSSLFTETLVEDPVIAVPPAALIMRAQSLLAELGYDPGPVDGVAGPRTSAAVRVFQAAVAEPVDGHVDEGLVHRLMSTKRSYGTMVVWAQARLAVLGYETGKIDGVEGPRTRAAIREFQKRAKFRPDGRVTPALLRQLASEKTLTRPTTASTTVISRAQSLLTELGYEPGPIDGIAGPRTTAAVRAYQVAVGTIDNGEISKRLVAKLMATRQDQTRLTGWAQKRLAALGHYAGPIDGVHGPRTRRAVKEFQQSADLPPDGRVTPELAEGLSDTIEKLRRQLEKRDAAIGSLMQRIEALEQKSAAQPARQAAAADWPDVADDGTTSTESGGSAPTSPDSSNRNEVDEDAITRALEETLIQEGGALLPAGVFEVMPEVTYTYRGTNGLRIVDVGGLPAVVDQDVRRDFLQSTLTARAGLPWDTQAEVRVPYIFDEEETVTAGTIKEKRRGSGLGDVQVSVSGQLLREGSWRPNLLATARWKSTTGNSDFDASSNDLPVGTGFHDVGGTLTVVRSHDPLVFFGSVSHDASIADDKEGFHIDPGDTTGFAIGTIFAASPDTSLRLAFRQAFTSESEVNGRAIPGSDEVQGSFELGAAAILTANSLLDFSVQLGVTDDAPDYRVGFSLPIRF